MQKGKIKVMVLTLLFVTSGTCIFSVWKSDRTCHCAGFSFIENSYLPSQFAKSPWVNSPSDKLNIGKENCACIEMCVCVYTPIISSRLNVEGW